MDGVDFDVRMGRCFIGPRGEGGAGRGEHALHARPRIGRAANEFDGFAVAGIDLADPEPVGVRVLFGLHDTCGDKRFQSFGAVLDPFEFEPDHGQRVGDLGK